MDNLKSNNKINNVSGGKIKKEKIKEYTCSKCHQTISIGTTDGVPWCCNMKMVPV